MPTPCNMVDRETNDAVVVTPLGQLVTAPVSYSSPMLVNLDVSGDVFNFIEPQHGTDIVITDIIGSANNKVSNTSPADVAIFAASSATSAVSLGDIVRPQLVRASNFLLTGLNLIISGGAWINATTTDNDILLTIMFYRVKSV